MDFTSALLTAVGALAFVVASLSTAIVVLWKRDIKRQAASESKVEAIRKDMLERMERAEASCRADLAAARREIDDLRNDLAQVVSQDRRQTIESILLLADRHAYSRDVLLAIADDLQVRVPERPVGERTTAQIAAITAGVRP